MCSVEFVRCCEVQTLQKCKCKVTCGYKSQWDSKEQVGTGAMMGEREHLGEGEVARKALCEEAALKQPEG